MLSGSVIALVVLGCTLLTTVDGFSGIDELAAAFEESQAGCHSVNTLKHRQSSWSPSQLVDVTGSHAFQPPKSGESRGPCPALNALANHGYMNRSGWTTFEECTRANVDVYNFDRPFSQGLCFFGQFVASNLYTLSWSIGNSSSYDPTVNSDSRAQGVGNGLAQSHNNFEGDHSMFQVDWHTSNGADASDIDLSYFQQMWDDMLPNGTFDDFSIFTKHHHRRFEHSVQNNPCMFNGIFSGLSVVPGGYAFAYRLYANHSVEYPEGTISDEVLASFFGVEIQENGLLRKKSFGNEQIPDNWYKRATPYTLNDFVHTDYKSLREADPRTSIFGGNINGIDTFTGVGIDDLSGGVFKHLLEGKTFPCFFYRFSQGAVPETVPGPGLARLGSTAGKILDSVFGSLVGGSAAHDCPQARIKDISKFNQYCGNRAQS